MPSNSTNTGRFVPVPPDVDLDFCMFEECMNMFSCEIGNCSYETSDTSSKAKEDGVLGVGRVDLKIIENSSNHHTDKFELATEKEFLIVRRGQVFSIDLEFSQSYDKSKDDVRLVFKFGKKPRSSNGTYIDLILSDKDEPKKWGAKILDTVGKSLTIEVLTPPDCPVGKWKLDFEVIKMSDTGMEAVYKFIQKNHMYILFNPWCKDDQVHMSDKTLLNEYVLNERGRIYMGTCDNFGGKPWYFAQFKDVVLDCCLYLLDKGQQSGRGDPVKVSRKISAMVNSDDDRGVLTGQWSEPYTDGKSPLKWSGSHKILEEYYKTKSPVKYGQCWVFSGIVTTVCRALGIPARSVTNFESAHDTDQSVSIELFCDENGKQIDISDTVWNFHVWNDVWMARPNLLKEYSGWQAIDATPQETSDGLYCMGPMPLEAIKRGDINVPYDGPFVFAEVNADKKVFMKTKKSRRPVHMYTEKNAIGKLISTKAPNSYSREDVTNQYKFEEGSEKERAVVRKAMTKEVEFDVSYDKDTFVGDNLELCVKITNNGTAEREVNGNLTLESTFYTGVPYMQIKRMTMSNTVIGPGAKMTEKLIVSVDEYMNKLTDHFNLKLATVFCVPATDYDTIDDIVIRLRKPHLVITPNPLTTPKVRTPYTVEVSFVNPLPVPLTECELVVEGPIDTILPRPLRKNIAPKSTMLETIVICPTTAGEIEIIVTFNSLELTGIDASHDICVSK